eukprot:189996-Rhodomonas_salina.1
MTGTDLPYAATRPVVLEDEPQLLEVLPAYAHPTNSPVLTWCMLLPVLTGRVLLPVGGHLSGAPRQLPAPGISPPSTTF